MIKKIEELKGSQKLKIQAAVMEVMETEKFDIDRDFGITSSIDDEDKWIMAFTNNECSLDNLKSLETKLGEKFKITISSKSKNSFLFRIEGPSEEFVRLAQNLKPLHLSPQSVQGQQVTSPYRTNNQ